jgi:hypothetical protein
MATSRDVVVDPHFFVPSGIIDARNDNLEDGSTYYDASSLASDGPVLYSTESSIPTPPSDFTVVKQDVRTASDGSSVIDVTIEFPDVIGVTTIDVKVSKL